jgi:adenosylhomocysteinase
MPAILEKTPTTPKFTDYKIKDIALADFGRKEIDIAEHEMPGLMSVRAKYGPKNPSTAYASPAHST